MFESEFLEFFSHINPLTIPIVYVPVIGYMIYLAFWDYELGVMAFGGMFLLGLFLWTFIEYSLHRWVFHYEPKTDWGKRLHFILHGVHHDYPSDATRLVLPLSGTVPLIFVFYSLYAFLFGDDLAPAVMAGFVFGYLCYDMLHYATHHLPMKRGMLLWLKQHHMRHHYQDDDHSYGVSSPLWDYIFGTFRRREPVEDSPSPVRRG